MSLLASLYFLLRDHFNHAYLSSNPPALHLTDNQGRAWRITAELQK